MLAELEVSDGFCAEKTTPSQFPIFSHAWIENPPVHHPANANAPPCPAFSKRN